MDRSHVDEWLRKYIAAWQSYEQSEIEALFTEDIEYRYHPWDEPVVGSSTIAKSWVESDGRDEPGTWEAEYRCVAVDGDTAVATGYSRYLESPGGPLRTTYDNCFVMRFAPDGRCAAFTEWFMERPKP